ncbi:energy transducer TonB [Verticiella sediminum]|uniref:Energy transducer TonB n=1 Tax=Verticiella sediminum TaxID=1247510 RepID=A0A556A7U8_9BURK|nr:energy transducer TonB [Verticiella sediminum]TSH88962.1 energy transducer TonB [Verticiella sediminum]
MIHAAPLSGPHWPAAARRYLYIGVAVSLAVHILVLALRFHAPAAPRSPADARLDVVLLNTLTQDKPVEPTVLAQADMDGGGEHSAGAARSPLPAQAEETRILLAREQTRQQELEALQRDLMVALRAGYAQAAEQRAGAGGGASSAEGQDDATMAQLAQQYAAIAARIEAYNRQPRRHYFAPSASAWPYAAYVEAWRERVEEVGNREYPEAARGRLYGSLRMTVFVRADGSVESMVIDQPSEHAVLNEAARDIVERAAPFAPFPDAVRQDTDVIAITRTWHFQNDAVTTSQASDAASPGAAAATPPALPSNNPETP